MAKFAFFAFLCTLSLLSFVQSLLSGCKTPSKFTLKRTSPRLAEKPVHPPLFNSTVIESKIMLMEAKVLRIENKLATILDVLLQCDDMALLEKYTCSAVVYNEGLTKTRPLCLLRSELRNIFWSGRADESSSATHCQ